MKFVQKIYSWPLLTRLAIVAFLYLSLATPKTASAHQILKVGNIDALVHINPIDSPVVDEPSSILFIINDSTQQFSLTKCACVLTISTTGAPDVNLLPSLESTTESLSYKYTFPKRGIYTLKLLASPKPGANFKSFNLNALQRVDRGGLPSSGDKSNFTWLIAAATIFAAIIGTYPMWRNLLIKQPISSN